MAQEKEGPAGRFPTGEGVPWYESLTRAGEGLARKQLWSLFIEGEWQLMLGILEILPKNQQIKWKAKLAGEKLSTFDFKKRWKLGKMSIDETIKEGTYRLEKKHKKEYTLPYTEMSARIEMLSNLPRLIKACGIKEYVNGGAVQMAAIALMSELPRNATGTNTYTVRNMREEHLMMAVEVITNIARDLKVDLPTIPDNWKEKLGKIG